MDVNPIEMQKYLKGVEYPASKQDLASAARENGAPDDLVKRLQGLDRDEFSGPDEVQAALKRS